MGQPKMNGCETPRLRMDPGQPYRKSDDSPLSWARELNERSTYLAHLLATLLPHHRELGLVRVRFTYRPGPVAALAR